MISRQHIRKISKKNKRPYSVDSCHGDDSDLNACYVDVNHIASQRSKDRNCSRLKAPIRLLFADWIAELTFYVQSTLFFNMRDDPACLLQHERIKVTTELGYLNTLRNTLVYLIFACYV